MELDITGLKDFEHTVHAVINSAEELNNLKTKVKNQRKTLNQQNNKINDLETTLDFDDSCLVTYADNYDDMQNKYYQLKNRFDILQKNNKNHLSKLIKLQHILNRDSDSEAMEFH